MTEAILIEIIKTTGSVIVAIVAAIGTVKGTVAYKKRNKKQDLNTHPVFAKAKLNKSVILNHLTLKNKAKELIFKDILTNHMEIYTNHLNIFCENVNDNTSESELYQISINTINNILSDLRTFYKLNENLDDKDKKAFEIIIRKYNTWDYDREIEIINRINDICYSQFYPDIYTKSVTILDTFLLSINDTVIKSNKTLDSINGDLKGLSFKGVDF